MRNEKTIKVIDKKYLIYQYIELAQETGHNWEFLIGLSLNKINYNLMSAWIGELKQQYITVTGYEYEPCSYETFLNRL